MTSEFKKVGEEKHVTMHTCSRPQIHFNWRNEFMATINEDVKCTAKPAPIQSLCKNDIFAEVTEQRVAFGLRVSSELSRERSQEKRQESERQRERERERII